MEGTEYKYNKSAVTAYLVTGIVCLILLIIMFAVSGRIIGSVITPCLLMLVFSFLYRNMTVIRLEKDYCEVKMSPIMGTESIYYTDVTSFYRKGNKLVFELSGRRPVKLHLSTLDREDREDIAEYFETTLGSVSF